MFLQDRQKRRSCLLGFAVFMALLPILVLIWLSDRLARLAIKQEKKAERRGPNPDEWPRCGDLPRPEVDLPKWRLHVGGEVEKPASFSLDDFKNMKKCRRGLPMHCVKGWTYNATWIGVEFEEIVHRVRPSAPAKWVEFVGADGYHECASLPKLLSCGAFLAYWFNDRPLPPNHGAPLRLIFPTKYGYKSVKWLTEILFRKERAKGYLADKLDGYGADGTIPQVGRKSNRAALPE